MLFGQSTIIETHDNGNGLPGSVQSKVFGPFFTTKRLAGGIMLGAFKANYVVYYSPGKNQTMQEKFFIKKIDAQKFMKNFEKQNPDGNIKCLGWNYSSHAPLESRRIYSE